MNLTVDIRPGLAGPRERLLQHRRGQRHDQHHEIGHDLVALSLKRLGITHVHGVPGSPVDATLAACARQGLRVIGARHQHAAVLAAAAQNYATGALCAAVIVSAGPAVANCSTGLLVARDNRWPVLVIGGRRSLALRGRGGFQDFDGDRFMSPLVKTSALVSEATDIDTALSTACRVAMADAPGPVYLDIAEDALEGSAAWTVAAPVNDAGPGAEPGGGTAAQADSAAVQEAARALALSERPVMLVGDGARWARPWGSLRRLVDDHAVPFAATPMARGFVPDSHPLCLTDVRGPLLAAADVVLVVGARMDWTLRFGVEIGPTATVIFVGSEATESAQSFGRGTALVGDAASILSALLHRLEVERAAGSLVDVDPTWTDALQRYAKTRQQSLGEQCAGLTHPMSPSAWLKEVAEALPANAVTVLDGNVVMSTAQWVLKAEQPLARLTPGQNGCMGTGIPFAIGMQLAAPQRPVVAVCGDFAFGHTVMELETAIRHKLPIIVIVANNSGPGGSGRQLAHFPADHPDRVAQFTPGIRHDLMMTALGGQGLRVELPGEMAAALRLALAHDGPTCIDVLTHDDAPLLPVV